MRFRNRPPPIEEREMRSEEREQFVHPPSQSPPP